MSVGELTFIGDRGFQNNQLCSCGEPFRDCSFWTKVVALTAGANPDGWFNRLVFLRECVGRTRRLPQLARSRFGSMGEPFASYSSEYTGMLGQIVNAISSVAGVPTVIDSSKDPVHGFHLSKSTEIDLYPVHLVRDSRAVAFSLQRVKLRPEIHWTTEVMPRVSPTKSAFDWVAMNSLMQLLGTVAKRYKRVRYEDIVQNPLDLPNVLLNWVGVHSFDQPVSSAAGEHELSGNPMRFDRELKVVLDREWMGSMSGYDYLTTTAISAPLLSIYGYQLARLQTGKAPDGK
jgi:hypothetical protein